MARCVDNPSTGRTGCGAEYAGELQHCVAPVPWSEHADGLAHITGRLSTIDKLRRLGVKAGIGVANPAWYGFTLDSRGVWRQPVTDEQRASLKALRERAT